MCPFSVCSQVFLANLKHRCLCINFKLNLLKKFPGAPCRPWLLSEGDVGVAHLWEVAQVDGVSFGQTLRWGIGFFCGFATTSDVRLEEGARGT